MKNNLFIAFEGIDGSGKTTQVKFLAQRLEEAGHKVYCTTEPTDSPIGSLIKDIFKHKFEADHRTIAGLYVADRLEHLLNKKNGILKKLEEGYTVITDRYYFSSYAYQGVHMPLQWVIEANSLSAELLRPDLNVFIDITPALSAERIKTGRNSMELYENTENLYRVREKYMEAFELLKGKENVFITDGNKQAHEIAQNIWGEVSQMKVRIKQA